MRLLRSSRYRAALAGAAMALGLITALAVTGAPATAATGNSSHVSSTATQETLISSGVQVSSSVQALAVEKEASAGYQGGTLISSPLGLHTPSIKGGICSSGTAHWFTLHINYLGGPSGWIYQCFGFQGTWYFPHNVILWACAGNNIGSFAWIPAFSGSGGSKNYGPGWTHSYPSGAYDVATVLTINKWSGTYNC